MSEMRAHFEKFAAKAGGVFDRFVDGSETYRDARTDNAWEVWKASAVAEQERCCRVTRFVLKYAAGDTLEQTADEVEAAIRKADA